MTISGSKTLSSCCRNTNMNLWLNLSGHTLTILSRYCLMSSCLWMCREICSSCRYNQKYKKLSRRLVVLLTLLLSSWMLFWAKIVRFNNYCLIMIYWRKSRPKKLNLFTLTSLSKTILRRMSWTTQRKYSSTLTITTCYSFTIMLTPSTE